MQIEIEPYDSNRPGHERHCGDVALQDVPTPTYDNEVTDWQSSETDELVLCANNDAGTVLQRVSKKALLKKRRLVF